MLVKSMTTGLSALSSQLSSKEMCGAFYLEASHKALHGFQSRGPVLRALPQGQMPQDPRRVVLRLVVAFVKQRSQVGEDRPTPQRHPGSAGLWP